MLPVSELTGRIGDKKVKDITTAKGKSKVVSLMMLVPYYNRKEKKEDTAVFWLDWYDCPIEPNLLKGDLLNLRFEIVHKAVTKDGKTQHYYQNRVTTGYKYSNGKAHKDDVTTDELENAYSTTGFDSDEDTGEVEPF